MWDLQRIRGKVTAKLLVVPALARFVYKNFAFLIYSVYSFYNFFVYGSCEPGGVCYLTPLIGWCIPLVEKLLVYVVLAVLVIIAAYFIVKRVRHKT
jgi:hypothetical protein